jgi:hypothetical protein
VTTVPSPGLARVAVMGLQRCLVSLCNIAGYVRRVVVWFRETSKRALVKRLMADCSYFNLKSLPLSQPIVQDASSENGVSFAGFSLWCVPSNDSLIFTMIFSLRL